MSTCRAERTCRPAASRRVSRSVPALLSRIGIVIGILPFQGLLLRASGFVGAQHLVESLTDVLQLRIQRLVLGQQILPATTV